MVENNNSKNRGFDDMLGRKKVEQLNVSLFAFFTDGGETSEFFGSA